MMEKDLPAGYVAQPAWRASADDGLCYEFNFVYDLAGRLDQDKCYWSVAKISPEPYGVGPFTLPRTLAYGLVRQAGGDVSFRSFAVPAARHRLAHWLQGPERRPVGVGGLQRAT